MGFVWCVCGCVCGAGDGTKVWHLPGKYSTTMISPQPFEDVLTALIRVLRKEVHAVFEGLSWQAALPVRPA